MKRIHILSVLSALLLAPWLATAAQGQNQLPQIAASGSATPASVQASAAVAATATSETSQSYVLCPSDLVQVKVYQEDDLESKLRISRDGTTSFPLIGVINLQGKTVSQAAALIREELAKDYLVNPQVTVTVLEYAKRRFTVLGQVQRPGTYEIPNEESVVFLQAIAMAGGYTRLANRANVTVTRTIDGRKAALTLDMNHATNDPKTPQFNIQTDDIITVPERIF
jgi:protein involved in polysaccharide export with SLBB domain